MNRMSLGKFLVVLTVLAAPCAGASSLASSFIAADNGASISFTSLHQDYKEFYAGTVPDSESGNIDGVGVTFKELMPNGVYSRLALQYSHGSDVYTGHTQGGVPLIGKTENSIIDAGMRLGRAFGFPYRTALAPYATLGRYSWRRGLSGAEPYDEYYHNFWIGVGLLGQWVPVEPLVLSAYGSIGRTVSAHMSTSGLSSYGVPDQEFGLGNTTRYKLGVDMDYAVTPLVHVEAGADYLRFGYGQSAVNSLPGGGASLEPESTTKQTLYRIGIDFFF